ncbi:hypothetical protein [Paraburkholderia sp.]|uniref:hypothetical protein n=1 Tax=Paraburkholderia sp. TaxID=1926495 RepID=UPI003D6FB8A3
MLSLLPGCSWFSPWFSHHRSHVEPVTGSLAIAPAQDFVYVPALSEHHSANRIENTAVSSIFLKQDVNAAVRDAIAAQLRLAGFDVAGTRRVLSGRIEKCFVDDERSPAHWTLKIYYVVTDVETGRVVYTSTKTVRREAPKFTNNAIALEDTVRANVQILIDDSSFASALN